MRCERAQEFFSDYCEGTLQHALMVPFESHLSECNACRGELDGLRALWSALDRAPRVEPPADFRAVVWQRIEESEAAKNGSLRLGFSWRTLFTRPALGLAAAGLVIAALLPVAFPGVRAGWLSLPARVRPMTPDIIRVAEVEKVPGTSGETLAIRLHGGSETPFMANVRIVSGEAEVDPATESVEFGRHDAEVRLRRNRGAAPGPITLEVRWTTPAGDRIQTLRIDP